MPPGLATTAASATVCGGTLTVTNAGSIALSGANISAGNSCNFGVLVKGTSAGSWINTTGQVSATNGGTGNTASATLVVGAPPTFGKAFGASSIPVNSSTSLTFSLANPNPFPLTGAAFTDSLPANMVVASPNALANTCGGSASAVAGGGSIGLSGGTIPASSSCTVKVDVKATAIGNYFNATSTLTTTQGLTGTQAFASLAAVGPPTLSKQFGAASIRKGAITTLTFTVSNPNSIAVSGIIFTDPLPLGLKIGSPNGLVNSCGGTVQAVPNSGALSLSGVSLPAGGSCTLQVNVTSSGPTGVKNNTTSWVTSNEAGLGQPATASITVTP